MYEEDMRQKHYLAIALLALLSISACAAPDAYVYHEDVFNRARADFGRDPTDLSEAVVCYSNRSASPAKVRALAAAECALVGKKSVYREQTLRLCPISTPSAAVFDCVSR